MEVKSNTWSCYNISSANRQKEMQEECVSVWGKKDSFCCKRSKWAVVWHVFKYVEAENTQECK